MKFLFSLLLFPFIAFSQSSKIGSVADAFMISGNIAGLPDNTLVFLARAAQPGGVVATAYSKKGAFVLFGKVTDADICQLSFIGYPETADLFLSAGNFKVMGNVKSLKQLSITGSEAHADYQQYNQKFNVYKERLTNLVATINKTPQSPTRDSLIGVFMTNKKSVLDEVDKFITAKPASPVSPFIMYVTHPISNDVAELERRFDILKPEAQETLYGKEITKLIDAEKVGMEGSQAIDFTQNDTANRPVALSSFKGKYVLVDFWASWCRPCRMENPNVVAAYNTFKDKNFTVLGVSLDNDKERWVQAINADNLTWTHVSDLKQWQNSVAQLYRITGIPANMLIDPSGKIIGKNLRGEGLQEVLKNMLK